MRRITRHVFVPFLVVGVAAGGDETERAKLRSAIGLPEMKFSVGASFTPSQCVEALEAVAAPAKTSGSEAKEVERDETALRKAVELDPADWEAWLEMAKAQGSRARRLLIPRARSFGSEADFQRLLRDVVEANPPTEVVAEARKLFEAERECYEKAVALAPSEPRARAARAGFRLFRGIFESCFLALERKPATLRESIFPPDSLADIRELGKLCPENPKALESVLLAGCCSLMLHRASDIVTPDGEKKEIKATMAALEKVVDGATTTVAARALEVIGLVEIVVFADGDRAATFARRALALDPTREKSIELLLCSLALDRKFGEAAAACGEALRRKESLRLRLIKATAHDRIGQLPEAEEEVRTALRIDPDDFRANLALAVLLLKKGDEEVLNANEQMAGARKLMGKDPSPDDRVAFDYVYGAFAAVVGSKETAKEYLRRVLEADKENKQAAELLRIISGEPPPERA